MKNWKNYDVLAGIERGVASIILKRNWLFNSIKPQVTVQVMTTQFSNLAGMTAVVTGASSGIGRAIAMEFARGGANIVLHCRQSVAEIEALAALIRKQGAKACIEIADFGKENELGKFVDRAWDGFGNVDIWVNNAGVDLLTGSDAQLAYSAKLQRLFEIDVRSTLLLSRLAGKRLSAQEFGIILNMGWDQADRGMEGDSGELFAAAKNAIMGATRSLALSLAPKVRVNCIAPGWIRTAWGEQAAEHWQERVKRETPLARWGTPEDVARLARFLASPDAAFITGQVINVNGGAIR